MHNVIFGCIRITIFALEKQLQYSKGKGKIYPKHATKAQRWNRGIFLLFPELRR